MDNGKKYTEKLSCSKDTKKLVMQDCRKVFLQHHPEFRGKNITQNHMLQQIATYYIEH